MLSRQYRPRAIILDIALRGEESWNWLAELKADGATREIPIMIATAVEDRGKGLALGRRCLLRQAVDA